jgi:hypothetical protein
MDSILNPTQLHLLKMFSFAKDSKSLEEIRVALTDVFAKKRSKMVWMLCGILATGITKRMEMMSFRRS